MAHINDAKYTALGAQGYTGNINERELKWLQANGATSHQLNDARREFLRAQGINASNINDGFYELLGDLGYTGSLSDRMLAFWKAGGNIVATESLFLAVHNVAPFVSAYRTSVTPWASITPIVGLPVVSLSACAFNPLSNVLVLAVNETNAMLYFYDTTTFPFTLVRTLNTLQISAVRHLSFTPDGNYLVVGTGSPSSPNRIYDLNDLPNFVALATGQITNPSCMAVNHDGSLIAMAIGTAITVYSFVGGVATPIAFAGATQPRNIISMDFHPSVNALSVGLSSFDEALFRFYNIDSNTLIGSTAQTNRALCYGKWNHNGTRFMGWMNGSFATIFNILYDSTVLASVATWPTIALNETVSGTGSHLDAVNSRGNYFAGWDSGAVAMRAYDITQTPPIDFITNFDVANVVPFDAVFINGRAS